MSRAAVEGWWVMWVELRNDFHNATCRLRVAGLPAVLSVAQVRRAKRVLCGVPECLCSGALGTRGRQDVSVEWTGRDEITISEVSP